MIVAVGHTHTKFSNLLSMLPKDLPVVKVFNGDNKRDDSFIVENNLDWRDIGMYKHAVDMCPTVNRFVFLNDDVQHLSREWWKLASMFLNEWQQTPDIIGVTNLASWAEWDDLEEPQKKLAYKQGRQPLFIRTSAFMATKGHFYNVLEHSDNAQEFEKQSLSLANRAHIVPAQWAYDSNIQRYV